MLKRRLNEDYCSHLELQTGVEISGKLDHFMTIILTCPHMESDSEMVMPLQWNRRVSKEPSEDRKTQKLKRGVPPRTQGLSLVCVIGG